MLAGELPEIKRREEKKNKPQLEEVILIEETKPLTQNEIAELITIIDSIGGSKGIFKTTRKHSIMGLPVQVDITSEIIGYLEGVSKTKSKSTQILHLKDFILAIQPYRNRNLIKNNSDFQAYIIKIEALINSDNE